MKKSYNHGLIYLRYASRCMTQFQAEDAHVFQITTLCGVRQATDRTSAIPFHVVGHQCHLRYHLG